MISIDVIALLFTKAEQTIKYEACLLFSTTGVPAEIQIRLHKVHRGNSTGELALIVKYSPS